MSNVSVAYIGLKSKTERSGKTKIGTQAAHVTRVSDVRYFQGQKVKGQLAGAWNTVADLCISLIFINSLIFMAPTAIGSKARWAPQA